ncbi:MAG: histidine phosphatase family protein [Pseudomonadota bacterium]
MSDVTRWWWIRHAPVTCHGGRIYGTRDLPCDTSEAAVFKGLAKKLPSDALWVTSHLQRTHQTADAIQEQMAQDARTKQRLIESDFVEQDFGDWQGMTHAELAELRDGAWHRFWLSPAHEAPPGGESFEQVVQRVSQRVTQLTSDHRGRDIVCVAHGGTIRAALAQALGLTPERALAFEVANCSLTRLEHIPGSLGSHDPHSEDAWRISVVNFLAA